MYPDIKKTFSVKKNAVILAIESSCDETAAAVIKNGREILSSKIMRTRSFRRSCSRNRFEGAHLRGIARGKRSRRRGGNRS